MRSIIKDRKMKLLFKQRFFSWFDSYDIYDEQGRPVFSVEGKLSWGHCLHIIDSVSGRHIATVKEVVLSFLPRFELYINDRYAGCIKKEFSFFKPRYDIDFNGWHIEGSFMEWDYNIYDSAGIIVAKVSKELWNWTDTYSIDVAHPEDALSALMFVLAIDAEKCSRD